MFQVRGNPRLKQLDRAIGIPAVRALGFLPKRRLPSRVRSIGILRTAAIGDTLLLRGVLEDLREQRPDARIVLITGANNRQAGELVADGIVEHVPITEKNPVRAIVRLRALRLDILVDSGSWPRLDALLTAFSGARYRVGFSTPGQDRHHAYDVCVEHRHDVHEVENFRALVRAIGIDSKREPSLRHALLPSASVPADPFFVFHPWSGGYRGDLKEWPVPRWIDLARELGRGTFVVVTGSPSEAARSEALASEISAAGIRVISITNLGLAELASLLKAARAVVSVNTGVMHLAAMVGAATVGLDGPTPPSRWGPIGPRVASVSSSLPGCGYLHLGFEYEGRRTDCMTGVDVSRVVAAVRAMI